MIETPDIERPSRELVEGLRRVGTATASAELSKLGVRNAHIDGPRPMLPDQSIAGPALTLQMLPKREDLYRQEEYADVERQLHRHVLYHTQAGDVVVVDARGDTGSGIFGEMMLTYFKGRGGAGLVINGCIRDYTHAKHLGLPMWLQGVTPNFHTQTNLMPWAVNVPIAVNNVTVLPGDVIIADDDGVVVVPIRLAPDVLARSSEHADWEEFSRLKLAEGGDLRKYYPLRADARAEYEAWREAQRG